MSATKAAAKWAKTATREELVAGIHRLLEAKATTSNPMIRSSLASRVDIINRELTKREQTSPAV